MTGVQSIERAFAILRALSVAPLGVTEIADAVDLPKSTVARLLNALEHEGAVEQMASLGGYRLGAGLSDLAAAAAPGRNLVATARPLLQWLTEETGEAAGLSVRDGASVYYLDHTEAEGDVQVRDWTGEYAPLHAVPSGLVHLAWLENGELDEYLAQDLEATTPNTVTEPDELRARLVLTRSAGYVWGLEEFAEGINSVAAPVRSDDGDLLAAIHVHGPAYRFPDPDRAHDLGLLVIEAADSLAEQLTS